MTDTPMPGFEHLPAGEIIDTKLGELAQQTELARANLTRPALTWGPEFAEFIRERGSLGILLEVIDCAREAFAGFDSDTGQNFTRSTGGALRSLDFDFRTGMTVARTIGEEAQASDDQSIETAVEMEALGISGQRDKRAVELILKLCQQAKEADS